MNWSPGWPRNASGDRTRDPGWAPRCSAPTPSWPRTLSRGAAAEAERARRPDAWAGLRLDSAPEHAAEHNGPPTPRADFPAARPRPRRPGPSWVAFGCLTRIPPPRAARPPARGPAAGRQPATITHPHDAAAVRPLFGGRRPARPRRAPRSARTTPTRPTRLETRCARRRSQAVWPADAGQSRPTGWYCGSGAARVDFFKTCQRWATT